MSGEAITQIKRTNGGLDGGERHETTLKVNENRGVKEGKWNAKTRGRLQTEEADEGVNSVMSSNSAFFECHGHGHSYVICDNGH